MATGNRPHLAGNNSNGHSPRLCKECRASSCCLDRPTRFNPGRIEKGFKTVRNSPIVPLPYILIKSLKSSGSETPIAFSTESQSPLDSTRLCGGINLRQSDSIDISLTSDCEQLLQKRIPAPRVRGLLRVPDIPGGRFCPRLGPLHTV